ncbi:hypothetical protein [Sphingomonas jaspsi]|jgi:hypothetical protein|uniref:hypothetical protein n=1 Tax=Sphingomonas jaspsi TaxID=392409 RepID=UPI0004AFBA40|nr:hypothetical protein [Sphingomonas jaspsi]
MMRLATLLSLAALAACSEAPTVLDGTSRETFARSAEQARRELPIADRLLFDAALKSPPGNRYSTKDPDKLKREAYAGMTAADVVADAKARGIE